MDTWKRWGALRVTLSALAKCAAVFSVGGCERQKQQVQLPVVRLYILTWPGYGPIYLGQAKGFFGEEGVNNGAVDLIGPKDLHFPRVPHEQPFARQDEKCQPRTNLEQPADVAAKT